MDLNHVSVIRNNFWTPFMIPLNSARADRRSSKVNSRHSVDHSRPPRTSGHVRKMGQMPLTTEDRSQKRASYHASYHASRSQEQTPSLLEAWH
jgi:hypothetical protein